MPPCCAHPAPHPRPAPEPMERGFQVSGPCSPLRPGGAARCKGLTPSTSHQSLMLLTSSPWRVQNREPCRGPRRSIWILLPGPPSLGGHHSGYCQVATWPKTRLKSQLEKVWKPFQGPTPVHLNPEIQHSELKEPPCMPLTSASLCPLEASTHHCKRLGGSLAGWKGTDLK